MVNINSGQLGNQFQLEPLDSVRANANNSANQPVNSSSGLQSLDSIRANNYSDPNLAIPSNDILAPIEAMNPELPEKSKEDTKEQGSSGFIGGVFKGFGRAGIDAVGGVVTLGKVVIGGVIHPSKTINWVGGGVKYAVNHPAKAIKAVAFDLPTGIINGITDPYKQAIKQGKYGEATGRFVFDAGMVLLSAGLGQDAGTAGKTTGTATEVVDKGKKGAEVIDKATKGTKVVSGVPNGVQVINNSGVNGGIHLAKDAIKITGDVKGNVIIQLGPQTTTNITAAASDAVTGAVTGSTEAVAAATAGKISLGLKDLGATLGKGFTKLKDLFSPVGSEISAGVNGIIGDGLLKDGLNVIGNGISGGVQLIKKGGAIVKAHPVASGLVIGKTVDVLDKGMKASDYYNPENN
jgi:hypothetical protein